MFNSNDFANLFANISTAGQQMSATTFNDRAQTSTDASMKQYYTEMAAIADNDADKQSKYSAIVQKYRQAPHSLIIADSFECYGYSRHTESHSSFSSSTKSFKFRPFGC